MELAALEEIEAGAARAGERQLDRLRLGPDRQVPVTHHRPQVGEKRAAARAVADVQAKWADALGFGAIHVVAVRHPVGPAGVDERGRDRVEIPGTLDMDRAARAAELTRPVLPVLRHLEQGQHRAEIPAGIAGLCPTVVVARVTAGPAHGVDAPRPAEYLAQRQGDGTAGDVWARLVMVGPVVSRAEVLHPLRRVRETLDIFNRPAGFEQED